MTHRMPLHGQKLRTEHAMPPVAARRPESMDRTARLIFVAGLCVYIFLQVGVIVGAGVEGVERAVRVHVTYVHPAQRADGRERFEDLACQHVHERQFVVQGGVRAAVLLRGCEPAPAFDADAVVAAAGPWSSELQNTVPDS